MTQTRDGATTALHRRIEELTAELAMSRAKYDRDISDKEIAHQVDLATERAAREQAEELRLSYWKETQLAKQRAEQAERERDTALAHKEALQQKLEQLGERLDTALARVEELQHCCDRACQSRSQLTRLDISIEKAFGFLERTRVDIEAGKPEPSAALCLVWLSNCVAEQRKVLDERLSPGCCDAALAAETALASSQARVKELEAELREALDLLQSKEGERLMRMAAETALASARELLRRLRELTEYYMLEVRNSEDRLKRVHRLQAQLARVGTRLHVKRAEAAHWQNQVEKWEWRYDKVNRSMEFHAEGHEKVSDAFDACRRQHEQCMKLLARSRTFLAGIEPLASLVDDMLLKGELPEGWDDK